MIRTLRRLTVTARKRHRCSLCTGRINAGERYERATNVYDGRIYDWLTCQPCMDDDVLLLADLWARPDNGVDEDIACEWAVEVVIDESRPAFEREAAGRYLDRMEEVAW